MTTNNHPAHGPVSLDRLHQIREILSKAAAQSDGGNLGYAMADAVKVIDGVIAAFDVEPVAWRYRYVHTPKTEEHGSPFTTEWKLCDSEDECNPSDCFERQPLYTAQSAPVVPETLPCAVELKPGLIIGKGCKTETLLVALQRRADYCAEIDAMTPEERAEHDANIKAFKEMLPTPDIEILSSALRNAPLAPSDSQGRPRAPVVPEECKEAPAYVKALTKEGAYIYGFNACRAAMLQAEPVSNSDELPLDYLQGHKDGLEWAAQLAEANHPQTGDWLYDDPIELARAIRKGPDMPPVQTASVVDADDNFYSWFGREWHEHYQHNQYTTAAKQTLGVMAESAWKAGRSASMLQAGNSPVTHDGLIAAVDRLLDSDGSRGCYSAIRCHSAREEVERLLAAYPQIAKPVTER